MDHLRELTGATRESPSPEKAARFREFAAKFAERAFRRPLDDEAKARYVDRQFESTRDVETAVKRVVLFVLESPWFLYREIDGRRDGYEVASRVSFGDGFAPLTVADERFCLPLPPDLADTEAAPLLCGGLIGYRALRLAGDGARLDVRHADFAPTPTAPTRALNRPRGNPPTLPRSRGREIAPLRYRRDARADGPRERD